MPDANWYFNDHYIQHLIAVSEQCSVQVCADIMTLERQVLFCAGDTLARGDLNRLMQKNLMQPLAMNIQLDADFSVAELREELQRYFNGDPVMAEIYRQIDLEALVESACDQLAVHPVLLQHLWVMKLELPRAFDRALFCAWFAVALYQRRSKLPAQLIEAFFAGLAHDLGLLYLPPAAMVDHSELDPDAWLQMARHPEIGYELLCYMPSMPAAVSRAVLEHHESIDGTGYPQQKVGKQLAPLGQLVYLLDGTQAIYVKYFQPRARTLHDLIPIVQMSQMSGPGLPASDLIMVLRLGSATTSCSVPEALMPLFIMQVKERHEYIRRFVAQAETFIEQNQSAMANARLYSLNRLLEHIALAMHQSGLINDAYIRWLGQVEAEKLCHAYREVEDVFLMMQEVLYHIQRFMLRLGELVNSHESAATQLTPIWAPTKTINLIKGRESPLDAHASTKRSLEGFSRHLPPSIPSELDSLWLTKVRDIALKNQS